MASTSFRPVDLLLDQADARLADAEGHGLERLVATLYEERSQMGLGAFPLTHAIRGWWDRSDTEIDLVAHGGLHGSRNRQGTGEELSASWRLARARARGRPGALGRLPSRSCRS